MTSTQEKLLRWIVPGRHYCWNKYSGCNHAKGIWGAGVRATTVTDPSTQAERAGASPRWKSTRGFAYAAMVLRSGERVKLACNHWFKYIGR